MGSLWSAENRGKVTQIRLSLVADMGRVVVQHHADDGALQEVRIDLFEQADEFDTAAAAIDVAKDMPGMQV